MQVQSFDQTFDKMNKALLVSCQKGLPVRVVRSFKVRSTTMEALPVLLVVSNCSTEAHTTTGINTVVPYKIPFLYLQGRYTACVLTKSAHNLLLFSI